MARPAPKFILYITAKTIRPIKIKFPKMVSNRFTKSPGIANIITHKTTNNVINPTTRFKFLREKIFPSEKLIII